MKIFDGKRCTKCGNGKIDAGEDCDFAEPLNSVNCPNNTCVCTLPFITNVNVGCSLCGNGRVDYAQGEQCDTALNGTNVCSPTTCQCEAAFPYNATIGSCQSNLVIAVVNELNTGVLAGALIAALVVVGAVLLAALLLFRNMRRKQKALEAQLSLPQVNFEAVAADAADLMNIASGDIKLEKELGRGAFGIVYKGSWRGTPVAVKRCSNMNADQIKEFIGEATFMIKNIRPHPNIVQMFVIVAQSRRSDSSPFIYFYLFLPQAWSCSEP
jgi:hypothetical protein